MSSSVQNSDQSTDQTSNLTYAQIAERTADHKLMQELLTRSVARTPRRPTKQLSKQSSKQSSDNSDQLIVQTDKESMIIDGLITLLQSQSTGRKPELHSIIEMQYKLNNYLIKKENLDEDAKNKINKLNKIIIDIFTHKCSVCKKTQSSLLGHNMNIEMIKMSTSWGYESNHDCETHTLALCCDCYDKYIYNNALGKYVTKGRYM